MSAVRSSLPDWIDLQSVTLSATNIIDDVAAKLSIPPGFTAQIIGAGNYAIGDLVNGVFSTFGHIVQRSTVGYSYYRILVGANPLVLTDTNLDSYSARHGNSDLESKLYYTNPLDGQILDFTETNQVVTLLGTVNIGPILEFKNIGTSTIDIWLGKMREILANNAGVIPDTTALSIRLVLTSFLASW